MRLALHCHMRESLCASSHNSPHVQAWFDASERVTSSFVVKTATNVVGADALEAMAAAKVLRRWRQRRRLACL